jgi:hypothetical protein
MGYDTLHVFGKIVSHLGCPQFSAFDLNEKNRLFEGQTRERAAKGTYAKNPSKFGRCTRRIGAESGRNHPALEAGCISQILSTVDARKIKLLCLVFIPFNILEAESGVYGVPHLSKHWAYLNRYKAICD